ncbi:MAG: response regulator [Cyclobacteriaceae bacterium]|nr:response regulator [Cyclobacteriaceae bacterium]
MMKAIKKTGHFNDLEFYKGVFERAPIGYFLCDKQGIIKRVNSQIATFSGYSQEELTGKNISRFYQPFYPGMVKRNTPHFHKKRITFETGLLHKTGKILPSLCHLHVINSSDGHTVEIEGFVQDISENTVRTERLERLNKKVNDALVNKKKFIAYLGHELKVPLNSLLGILYLFDSENLNHTQVGQLDALRTASRNMQDFIKDLFQLAELEAGKKLLNTDTTDTALLFNNLCTSFSTISAKKGIKIQFSISEEVPERIIIDRAKVLRIFNNLIANAIKYSGGSKVSVTLKIEKYLKQDGLLMKASVKDNGKGIEPAIKDEIFDLYVQEETSRKEEGSTGLGLWLVRELVYLMNGKIGLDTKPGKGALFWFTFEATIPRNAGKTDEKVQGERQPLIISGKDVTILIVDDNKFNREITSKILSKAGAIVHTAVSGDHALQILKTLKVDLVLMDIQMPVHDGLWTVQQVRKVAGFEDLMVVALSGYETVELENEENSNAFNLVLSKPIEPDTLIKSLNKLLKGTEVQKEKQYSLNNTIDIINFEVINKLEKFGDKEMVLEAFDEFEKDFLMKYEEINSLAKKGNYSGILYKLHAIKANSATLGLSGVFMASLNLEQDIENNDLSCILTDIDLLYERFTEFTVYKSISYN